MAKKKAAMTMLGTLRVNLTFRVAEVRDKYGDSMFVLPKAVLDYLQVPKLTPKRCQWFGGSGHLCFLRQEDWHRVNVAAMDANLDIVPFDGYWDLTDEPKSKALTVYQWADQCCKEKHPGGLPKRSKR